MCSCSCRSAPSRTREDDENIFDWEDRDVSTPFWQHAAAGSCAGIMEHVGMYPLDTVKTRMQASSSRLGVAQTLRLVVREQGVLGLMRGSSVIGVGCIPAHVGLFSTYELAKLELLDPEQEHQPLQAAACGAVGTVVHDMVITPIDTVKQRLQLGGFSTATDCAATMFRREGIAAFYRSLPATLVMNIPYTGLLVAANESLKHSLSLRGGLADAPWYFLTAGISGAFSGALTLPLDVVKTRLQTQRGPGEASASSGLRYSGIISTVRAIAREEGMVGFFRGMAPRIMIAMPSAAICWGTYECVRTSLSIVSGGDVDRHAAVRDHNHLCDCNAGAR